MKNIQLHNGDCLDIMPNLPDNSVDLILTDPPYFKVKSEDWDRQWDKPDAFLAWLSNVLSEYYRILKPNGSLYVFASPQMSARVECLVAERFEVLNRITWAKPEPTCEINKGAGNGGLVSKATLRKYYPNTESVIFAEHQNAESYAKGEAGYSAKCDELRGFVFEPLREYLSSERTRAGFTTRDIAVKFQKKTGSRTVTGMASHWFERVQWTLPTEENYLWLRSVLNTGGDEYLKREYEYLKREYEDRRTEYEALRRPFNASPDRPYTDVWTYKTVRPYKGKHPCEKPQELLRHVIEISSKPDAVVLDSFMGTGSTGLACKSMSRHFIGIEKSPDYFAQAEIRLSERDLLDTA